MLGLLPFFKLALAELQEAHHTFGLVVDYACLPQKPFASDEEAQRADHPRGPSPAGSLLAELLGPCPARSMAVGLSAPRLALLGAAKVTGCPSSPNNHRRRSATAAASRA